MKTKILTRPLWTVVVVLSTLSACKGTSSDDNIDGFVPRGDIELLAPRGVGSPCETSADCPIVSGTKLFCETQPPDGGEWLDGYCTVVCSQENPKCPMNTLCVESHCLVGCGGPSDCRPGYECQAGWKVCKPLDVR